MATGLSFKLTFLCPWRNSWLSIRLLAFLSLKLNKPILKEVRSIDI